MAISKKDKLIREYKRLANKLFGTNYALNSTNKLAKTCMINRSATLHSNITIGEYTLVHSNSYIFDDVEIGNYCSIAAYTLIGGDEHRTDTLSTFAFKNNAKRMYETHHKLKTIIGHDVWIGANAIIKRGVKIGTGAVIGSGSIVTKDIPPFAIAVGVPAKVIRYRFDDETQQKILSSKWWELDKNSLDTLEFNNIDDDLKRVKALKKEEV